MVNKAFISPKFMQKKQINKQNSYLLLALLQSGSVPELDMHVSKHFLPGQFIHSVPSDWKKANITPVYKNNNPNDVKNYRPISLLNVISKCMERCVYKYVHNFFIAKQYYYI
jgi:hypothetical protein